MYIHYEYQVNLSGWVSVSCCVAKYFYSSSKIFSRGWDVAAQWLHQASVLTLLLLLLLLVWTLSRCFVRCKTLAVPPWCDLTSTIMLCRRLWSRLPPGETSLVWPGVILSPEQSPSHVSLSWTDRGTPAKWQANIIFLKKNRFCCHQLKLSAVLNTFTNPSRINIFWKKNSAKFA